LVALLVTLFLSSFAWAQDVTFTFEDLPLGDIPPDGVVIARTLPAGVFIPNYDPNNPPADDHIAIRVSRTGPAPARIDEVPDVDGRPEWGSRTLSPFADPFDPSRMVIEVLHVSPDGPDERGVEYIAWEMGDFYPSDIDEYEFQTFAAAPAVPVSITGGGILGIPPPFPPPLFLATYKWVQRAHPITRFEVVGGSAEPVPEGAPFYPHSLYYDNFVFTVSAVNQFQGTDVPASDFGGEFLSAGLGNTGGDPTPTAKAIGGGPYECGSDTIVLNGTVSDSTDGALSYKWVRLVPGGGETVLGQGTVTVLAGEETSLPGKTVDLCFGVHTIELRVLDVTALEGVDTAYVEVVDTTPPTLESVCSSHSELWPPNHQMVTVTIKASASDNCCDPTLAAVVTSNEPEDSKGDGRFVPDWTEPVDQTNGTITFDLRAERSGKGDGRTYTVSVTAVDGAGNVSLPQTVTITVPHDKGKKGKK
jgi:hypothetical protein